MTILFLILFSYLLGSIPFGLLFIKGAGLGDIRSIGSGNIGATNVLRTGKKHLAFLTLLCDGGKGLVAVLIVEAFWPGLGQLAGLAALLGHLFPVWLEFKGGKGVATSLGVLLGVAWPVGLAAMACWLLAAFLFRISSLAALISIGLTPLTSYIFGYEDAVWFSAVIVVLVFIKHEGNVWRLLKGTEPKIGEKKKENATPPAQS